MKIYYTDKIVSNNIILFLDSVTNLEYVVDGLLLWESKEAGEILIKSLGPYKDITLIKRS